MAWIGPIAPNSPSMMNVGKFGIGAGYENEKRVQIEQVVLNVDLLRQEASRRLNVVHVPPNGFTQLV